MTDQVILCPVSAAWAQQIVAHLPDDDEVWAADFPGEADAAAATMFLLLSQVYGNLGSQQVRVSWFGGRFADRVSLTHGAT